jgi:hypothetical protein
MSNNTRIFLAVLTLAALAACSFNVSKQNPEKAAASAIEFAKAAFVEKDTDKAFNLLDPEFQAYATKEKFTDVISVINTPTSPTVVTATEFEPIPGQDGVNVFLVGEKGAEKFYYRIPMKGTEAKGYKAAGVFRVHGQFPPSESRQPLQVKRSTGS